VKQSLRLLSRGTAGNAAYQTHLEFRDEIIVSPQVTGGSDFDTVWNEWAGVCLVLLREAADMFARGDATADDGRNRGVDVNRREATAAEFVVRSRLAHQVV
jgi:hypothetical protein